MKNTTALTYNLLNCSAELKESIALIADTLQPEKIFLMEQEEDNHTRNLVIIMPEIEQGDAVEIHQLQGLNQLTKQNINFRNIKSTTYETLFKVSPIYFTVTCNKQTLAYDDGYFAVLEGKETNLFADKEHASLCFDSGMERMTELLAEAKTYSESNSNQAALRLYTATATCLNTLLTSLTGEISSTSQLNELIESVALLNCGVHQIFTDGTSKDERLLNILHEANSRNSVNSPVAVADVDELITRITLLQKIAESTFADWLGRYEFHFLNNDIDE